MSCGGRFCPGGEARRAIALALAGVLFVLPAIHIPWAEGASSRKNAPPREPKPSYRSAILIEADSGQILRSHNPRLPVIPASIVKMMTAYLAFEHIRMKKARMEDRVKVSRAASHVGGHQVHLRPGEVFAFRDLLKAVMISSANDAAFAVAEQVAGNETAFVRLMNQRARQLGMTDSRFVNVNGLPERGGKPSNLMSARDAALLARRLIKEYPFVLEWTSTRTAPFRPGKFNLHNTNRLVGRFEGLDGLKTGFTPESGFSLVATAKRGKVRLISVGFGSPQSQRRFNDAKNLLAWGFSNYSSLASRNNVRTILRPSYEGASLDFPPAAFRLTWEGGDRPGSGNMANRIDSPEGFFLAAQPDGLQPSAALSAGR